MSIGVIALLVLTSNPNDKGFQIMQSMLLTLKDAHSVTLTISGEELVNGRPMVAKVKAGIDPVRFWAELREGQTHEFVAYSGGKMAYHGDDGLRVVKDVPTHNLAVNNASTFAVYGWQTFFDLDKPGGTTPDTCFYVHEEEVEGHLCDLVGLIRPGNRDGPSTMIRYFWIDRDTHLPRAFQLHAIYRGRSPMGPKWTITDLVLNPVWDSDPLQEVPERIESAPKASPGPVPIDRTWKEGDACPDLQIQTLEMESVRLPSLLKGRTLVTFWAPWCGPCLGEMEALAEIPEVESGSIQVIAIGVSDSKENVRRYARDHSFPFRFAIDPDCEREESAVAKAFGVTGIPHAFLFDEDGRLVRQWFGFKDKEDLRRKLTKGGS